MAKYKVEVGGHVTVYRQRTVTVSAESEEEAKEKAIDKFYEQIAFAPGWHDCGEGHVNSIEQLN